MGSGFSACTSPTSVRVSDSTLTTGLDKNKSAEHAHSDSCDSGISVTERHRQSSCRSARTRSGTGLQVASVRCHEEEEGEEGVPGTEIGVSTDSMWNSTPRPAGVQPVRKAAAVKNLDKEHPLRHSPHSAPNLLEHAINEEVEEEPEDKRLKRPPRPKSAHFRKSRAQLRARTAKSRQAARTNRKEGGDNSFDDSSSEENYDDDDYDDDFDSDVLSIPDETVLTAVGPKSVATVKLGPQFNPRQAERSLVSTPIASSLPNADPFKARTSAITNHANDDYYDDDEMDWWRDDGGNSTTRLDGSDTARSMQQRHHAGSVSSTPSWREGRVSKKASERSISSILLTTVVEPDCPSPFPASTNPACFAVTNPEITQHILKSLHEMEEELTVATLTLAARDRATLNDYVQAVASLTPRAMRLLGDFKMTTGEVLGRLPAECKTLRDLEEDLARRLMTLNSTTTGSLALSPLLIRHLQDIEELCQREATVHPRTFLVQTQTRRKQRGLANGPEAEDEDDFMEDIPHSTIVSSNMSSERPRKSARRHSGVQSLPSTKVPSVVKPSSAETCFTKLTTSIANGNHSGNCVVKKRPDSGIVVTSCSASNSSSEVMREPDADLADQTEWIATSLEMLEQILQVRTESHETIKSLVDAITAGSTSDKLKAHALYRWLASQSMAYYKKCTSAKLNSPTGKLRQLAERKISYATLYQEMARAGGLKCEKIEGYAKGPDYRPGTPLTGSNASTFRHSWNAVLLNGHYHFVDAGFGALPCKFFVEHYFLTPPDEMRLSHFPLEKRWLLMTQQHLALPDFEGTLKTWPTMFAFNIRPLNMQSVLRSYDGRLSITVLLRNVAVSPQLKYVGPGHPQDAEALAFNVDQEIRNVDNAETFHLNLAEEGTYYFTLMVHDLEDGEDIPAFQYRVEYQDELL